MLQQDKLFVMFHEIFAELIPDIRLLVNNKHFPTAHTVARTITMNWNLSPNLGKALFECLDHKPIYDSLKDKPNEGEYDT